MKRKLLKKVPKKISKLIFFTNSILQKKITNIIVKN